MYVAKVAAGVFLGLVACLALVVGAVFFLLAVVVAPNVAVGGLALALVLLGGFAVLVYCVRGSNGAQR